MAKLQENLKNNEFMFKKALEKLNAAMQIYQISELSSMKEVPQNFISYYRAIIHAESADEYCLSIETIRKIVYK